MSVIKGLGSLGPDGWVITPLKKFQAMMAHFFVNEYSQTHLFNGRISSLTYIVQSTQGDVSAFCAALDKTLMSYLSTMFNSVVVDVAEVPSDRQFYGEVRLYVSVRDDDGTELNLGKVIRTENGLLKEIIDIVNG